MKTKSFHKSNLGSFCPPSFNRVDYVVYHDSPRYAKAGLEQLEHWAGSSNIKAVRNAALTELAERELAKWRNMHSR